MHFHIAFALLRQPTKGGTDVAKTSWTSYVFWTALVTDYRVIVR